MNIQPAGLLMATAAQQVDMAPAMPASLSSWQWLKPAAEMAGISTAYRPVQARHLASSGNGSRAFPRVATRTPPTGARAVTDARKFATVTLANWGVTERSDDITMVVSELLTNAFRHALSDPAASSAGQVPCSRRVRLGLLHTGYLMFCAVADPSDQLPVLRQPDDLAETGRGLHVVEALADRWGYFAPGVAGKVVWATFTAPSQTISQTISQPTSQSAGQRTE